jgi:hypothetical protein
MFVTAMVTLAGPLAPNMPLTQVFPTAFSISDGLQTITNFTTEGALFFFGTGPTGAITSWSMAVSFNQGRFITSANTATDVGDIGFTIQAVASNTTAGVWAGAGQVPDTGSTLSLMTLTLMALGVAARQFKRAAA